MFVCFFFFSSRRRHTRCSRDWSSDVCSSDLASLEAEAGLPGAAESLYRTGLAGLGDKIAPEIAWRLHAGLGLARHAQGRDDDATRELRAALAEIERPSRSLALAERRSAFLADKWDVYGQLALIERARGRPEAAFEASERLRAREMLELLQHGRLASPDTAAELVSREQDLRHRIAELTHDLDSADADALRGPDAPPASGATHEALGRAQEAYTELLLDMRERSPRHATLVSPVTATWRDVGRRLGADAALIEYLVSDSGSLAFVVARDTVVIVDLGVRRHDLARLVEFARGALLGGSGRGRFLIERYEVAVTPSASVWLALGDRPAGPVASGTLVLAPRPDVLPASRREAAAVGRLGGADVQVLTGSAATEAAFRREAPRRRILHLATYGVLNKQNPLFSFVDLARDSAQDGRLEVHEVFGLHLAADLVVLSACQTGLGAGALADVPAGDDWVGLTRAFLHAGAANVVATLWPVEDWATAALMEEFYRAYVSGADPAHALAEAQRALLAAPTTSQPFYWAGFVITEAGDGKGVVR